MELDLWKCSATRVIDMHLKSRVFESYERYAND